MTDKKETTGNKDAAKAQKKVITGRSPAYPFISLEKALNRAKEFLNSEGKHAVPFESAYKAWGYGGNSSNARQTIAAMRYFGLMESTDDGNIRLTKLALDILLDQQAESIERQGHIKRAAMMPKIHKELWDKWQDELPSDATILTYLIRDRGFNETAGKDLLAEYKDTLTYSKVSKFDNIPPKSSSENNDNMDVNGNTDIVMHEIQTPLKTPIVSAIVDKMLIGERLFLSGPLSKDGAAYRLIVSGSVGSKELGKLIKMLTLQKEILDDVDEEVNDLS